MSFQYLQTQYVCVLALEGVSNQNLATAYSAAKAKGATTIWKGSDLRFVKHFKKTSLGELPSTEWCLQLLR